MTETSPALVKETFGQLLILVARTWRRKSSDALLSLGLSAATAEPLLWLSRAGGCMRQGHLAELIGIEGPSLVRLIDQLQMEDLVVRHEDPKDRRAKTLHLTPKGSGLAGHVDHVLQGMRANVLQNVSDDDLETTTRILRAIEQELARDDESVQETMKETVQEPIDRFSAAS
jgi:MarR family transcriptional regulator, transcriptional regulator for hemolysin